MNLIIGLGNPGEQYKQTRHNSGFLFVEEIARRHRATFQQEDKFISEIAKLQSNNKQYLLQKPQTFMNDSGRAASLLINYYHLNPENDLLVVYDDIDLPLGSYRWRGESAGGHKGMQSVITALSTNKIKRLRLGIASPDNRMRGKIPTDRYVLAKFTPPEFAIIKETIARAADELLAR